ncbi:hypothetical protein MGG_16928, partial [Pyricularia oryzae 70-15]
LCRPGRVFYKKEELVRHTLGHGFPQYACENPGCDRGFYRADLLARHRQHDHSLELVSQPRGTSDFMSGEASTTVPGTLQDWSRMVGD